MTGETDRHILSQVVGMLPTFVCIPMERTNLSHFRGFFEIKSTLHRIRCFIRQPNHACAKAHSDRGLHTEGSDEAFEKLL